MAEAGARRCGPPEGLLPAEARGGAAAAVRGLYDGLRGGDPEALYRWLEPDVLMLGTAPEEIWAGQPAVAAALGPRLGARSGAFIHEGRLDIRVAPSLTTAFFHDEVRLAGTTRTGAAIDLPMRVTGTLVRREGGWRVAAVHFSVPIPDADSARYDRASPPAGFAPAPAPAPAP
jgi:ketosteroid isomerase-like protein